VADYLAGRWEPAAAGLAGAEELLTDRCTGVMWELDSARSFSMGAQYWLGNFRRLAERFPALAKDAHDRGDIYASTQIGTFLAHLVLLSAGDAVAASRHAKEAMTRWPQDGVQMPHLWEFMSIVHIALYTRRGREAWELACRFWPALKYSLLLEVQLMRILMLDLRGRAAIAAAGQVPVGTDRERCLADALRCAQQMHKQRTQWGKPIALIIEAGVHYCSQRNDEALRCLEGAQRSADAHRMQMIAAVARRRRGDLIGGSEGFALVAASEAWMRAEGITDPPAMAIMFAPWQPAASTRSSMAAE
jgi:hypothetical protein